MSSPNSPKVKLIVRFSHELDVSQDGEKLKGHLNISERKHYSMVQCRKVYKNGGIRLSPPACTTPTDAKIMEGALKRALSLSLEVIVYFSSPVMECPPSMYTLSLDELIKVERCKRKTQRTAYAAVLIILASTAPAPIFDDGPQGCKLLLPKWIKKFFSKRK
jgi:hypothetical protein